MSDLIGTKGSEAISPYRLREELNQMLGSSASYLGEELSHLSTSRIKNIGKIVSNAKEKLGDSFCNSQNIAPRVLEAIVNEGSYCEDSITIEYLGGILASSRNNNIIDDRGARIAKILTGMSTYQIRSHYLIYSLIKKLYANSSYHFSLEDRSQMRIFIPIKTYLSAINFNNSVRGNFHHILSHSLYSLYSDHLIGLSQSGPMVSLAKSYSGASSDGIIVEPSSLGAELYLWGYGKGNEPLSFVLNADKLIDFPNFSLILDGVSPSRIKTR